ncbi:hypothetical protein [Rhizobacter sp. OV335]|uniref:hypothetical protein n=1 Tax=Rhizobacter sp. OV335 TaxID=1500264 RepID=UPI0009207A65|nr:hypothetical protein [Rhizobacter sp. OV335]SHN40315.1 hypothetical protein SAMN02787076_06211 [Rhizobacter sp. OV335]
MSSDDSLSQGTHGFRAAGTGLAMTRNCFVGQHHVMHTAGSIFLRFGGAKVWCCAGCAEKRAARRAEKAAA